MGGVSPAGRGAENRYSARVSVRETIEGSLEIMQTGGGVCTRPHQAAWLPVTGDIVPPAASPAAMTFHAGHIESMVVLFQLGRGIEPGERRRCRAAGDPAPFDHTTGCPSPGQFVGDRKTDQPPTNHHAAGSFCHRASPLQKDHGPPAHPGPDCRPRTRRNVLP